MVKARSTRKADRTEVTADECRDALGAMLDRAGFRGERIVVTRHGKQLAALVSIDDLAKLEQYAA